MGSKPSKAKTWRNVSIVLGILVIAGIVWMSGAFSVSSDTDKVAPDEEAEAVVFDNGQGVKLPAGVTEDNLGKAASLSLAAFNKESASNAQVAVPAYVWKKAYDAATGTYDDEWTYLGSTTLSASARTTYTSEISVGDQVQIIAFNGTYPYGEKYQFVVSTTNHPKNLDVYDGSGTMTISFFDEDGDSVASGGNITVGTTNYVLDKIRFTNDDDYSRVVPKAIAFEYPSGTNISQIRVSGLADFTEKIDRLEADDVYVWEPGVLNNDLTRAETGSVTIQPDGDNVASETITVYVIDLAPYIGLDQQLHYGVQDDAVGSQADVGVSDESATLLLI